MAHKNYFEFKAENNFDLGKLMGENFSNEAKRVLEIEKGNPEESKLKIERAKKYLDFNQKYFPQYVEELRGYAESAGLEFLDLYTLSLEDEVAEDYPNLEARPLSEKCTTFITNDGKTFAHNEDWDKGSEEKISIVRKTVGNLYILELYYANTLGGNSVSINSNGFTVGINSLVSTDTKMGLSKNVICRWLSETKDPDADIEKLKTLPRSVGYNVNIANGSGKIWNAEYTSSALVISNPESPFAHTNHYLTELSKYEANTNKNGTFDRYDSAMKLIRGEMTEEEIIALENDTSYGEIKSIFNERTIAKIIVDLENKNAKIWLLRETEMVWVEYRF